MTGPLSGIRVLELSRILAGPWAGQLLADFGADVLKVERPGSGDDTRAWGPPFLKDAEGKETGESAYYLSCNRGKRSLAVDLADPEGAALVRRLALAADILIENFKVDGLARYGLDAASLEAEHPGLIYCSITGFGQDGPYAQRAGYDAMIQAEGGLMSLTGVPDGEPGAGPQKVGVAVSDLMCGMYAVTAVLAALHHRQRTGQGQRIDLALFDTQVAWLANQASNYLVGGEVPQRLGSGHPNIVPYQAFAVADGHLMLAIGNDAQFQRFCSLAGRPELGVNPRFFTNADRVRHRAELIAELCTLLRQRDLDSWLALLTPAGIPCGPINTLDRVFADPQVRHRGLYQELPHGHGGNVPGVANPVRYSRTPVRPNRAPPLLGEGGAEAVAEWLAGPATDF